MTNYTLHIPTAPEFLLTCLLRGMTCHLHIYASGRSVSTHMPLARHDIMQGFFLFDTVFLLTCLLRGMTLPYLEKKQNCLVSTHMPLARHDRAYRNQLGNLAVSTHMPLARHDLGKAGLLTSLFEFLLTCLLRGMTRSGHRT